MKYTALIISLTIVIFYGCKKDKPNTIPVLTTIAASDITADTAVSGGVISSNGGAYVMNGGVCWSETNSMPTINNDSTKANVLDAAEFISVLKKLKPNTSYYIRAYAINSVGIGYGNVLQFTSGNAAPVASNVNITGTPEVNKILTANYTYSDFENEAESGTTITWYIANDGTGAGESIIAGATTSTYTIQPADEAKFIRVGITPKAATGTSTGVEVRSAFIGAIGEPSTVTFMYNGQSVTYGILTSPVTGRKWLDRNLGAPNVPSAWNDWASYGDLFQWGRLADGHQLITRGSTTATTTGVNGTTTATSASDDPGTNLFIIGTNWRNPNNDNLWQGVNGINNPCPAGWRIPTQAEWIAENFTTLTGAYTQIKITSSGQRRFSDGGASNTTVRGAYWSSTVPTLAGAAASFWISNTAGATAPTTDSKGTGNACRCIKN